MIKDTCIYIYSDCKDNIPRLTYTLNIVNCGFIGNMGVCDTVII